MPTRSWTWTAIPCRPLTERNTSAARASRSLPTAVLRRSLLVPAPGAELDDPAYAEPLLIHIAALLRTVENPATPSSLGRVRTPPRTTTSQVSRARRSGSGCCGRCASGNGPAGMTWGRICRSTRTCRWPTRWWRWPR